MKMWKTYISPRLSSTRGTGDAGGEGSLDLRVGLRWLERPSCAKRTAMPRAAPCQHHRHLVDRLSHRVLHLRMKLSELSAVLLFFLIRVVELHGKRGLRLGGIGPSLLHHLPRFHLLNRPPAFVRLHRKTMLCVSRRNMKGKN